MQVKEASPDEFITTVSFICKFRPGALKELNRTITERVKELSIGNVSIRILLFLSPNK